MTRRYSELCQLETFRERYDYLKLPGSVGFSTFGYDRYLNQGLYRSKEWRDIRSHIILRDECCDLGVPGYELAAEVLIHHMNPMGTADIVNAEDWIFDPEYLITTCKRTHNAIHYGTNGMPVVDVPTRTANDTKLW